MIKTVYGASIIHCFDHRQTQTV